ncbi:MAG: M23 family metallopeptidase, partial [Pseudomonadota bacterium]
LFKGETSTPKILNGERMKGKLYLIVYFCVFLSVSCSSLSGVNKTGSSSLGFGPETRKIALEQPFKKDKAPACLSNLISDACEQGALAGVFSSKARLVSKVDSNLPIREFNFPLTSGELSSPFGYRRGAYHAGLDISAKRGDPVFACADGVVSLAGRQKKFKGLGLLVTLEHEGSISTDYAHLSKVLVHPGQRVRCGDLIGLVGSTGRSTSPHLHLQVRNGAQFYDPIIFFNQSQLAGIQVAENFLEPVRERMTRFRPKLARVRN